MAPIVPSVEAATIETGYTAAIVAQGTAGDEQTRKEQLQHDEINNHPQQTIKKLIEIVNEDLHIVLPGIIIILLFYLGFFFQQIAIGPFMYALGAYLDFFAVILIEIIHAFGMEIY